MFCEFCGAGMTRARCPKCRKHSSAFWFTVLGGFFLLVTVAAYYAYYAFLVPVIAIAAVWLGMELPLPARLAFALGHYFTEVWFLVLILLLLIGLAVLVRKGKATLGRAGEVIAAITLVLLLVLLMGAGATEVWMLGEFPAEIRSSHMAHNELLALTEVEAINRAQRAVAQNEPALGYSCSVSDLAKRANKIKDFGPAGQLRAFGSLGQAIGYDVSITACSGPKPAGYKILAMGIDQRGAIQRSYCFDPLVVMDTKLLIGEKERQAFAKACQ